LGLKVKDLGKGLLTQTLGFGNYKRRKTKFSRRTKVKNKQKKIGFLKRQKRKFFARKTIYTLADSL